MDEVSTSQYYSNQKQIESQRKTLTGEEIERKTALLEWAIQLLQSSPDIWDTAPS